MDQRVDSSENYKRYVRKCRCSCEQHCGHSCLNCDYCTECECELCLEGQSEN